MEIRRRRQKLPVVLPPLSWTLQTLLCWDGYTQINCLQLNRPLPRRRGVLKALLNLARGNSSKPTSDDLKSLDDKWSERFLRLEALLSKSFAVPVEPVKPSTVVTREHPFFDPGTVYGSSSVVPAGLVTERTGPSLVQTTGEAAQLSAIQPPLGVPGMNAVQDVSKSATHPVQGPGTSDVATQPLQAPGAEIATQPLQAPGADQPPSLHRLPVQVLKCCQLVTILLS